jgi:coproporphyrinogen III oxidase-like Fe-S oxidoreductase
VISLRPDRIACYNYAHLPERFLPQRSIDRLTLPEPEEKLLLAQMISATLQDAGYRYIGMDHYVLPDDDLPDGPGRGPAAAQLPGLLPAASPRTSSASASRRSARSVTSTCRMPAG